MATAAAIAGAGVLGAVVSRNATNKSVNATAEAGRLASEQLSQATQQARGDLFRLFPASQQNAQQGFQGALDVFNQALPQQAQTLQDGNVAAQNQLLAGMPQFQNMAQFPMNSNQPATGEFNVNNLLMRGFR